MLLQAALSSRRMGCVRDAQGNANCAATPVSGPTDELTCQQAVEREDPLTAGAVWYQRLAGIPPGTSANYWWGKAYGAQGGRPTSTVGHRWFIEEIQKPHYSSRQAEAANIAKRLNLSIGATRPRRMLQTKTIVDCHHCLAGV